MDEIFTALPALLDQHCDNEDVRRAVVFAVWRRVAGSSLSGRAVPIDLAADRLIIAVGDRNWQRNLERLAAEMIFRMNFVFGRPYVKFIEFVVDGKAVTQGPKTSADPAFLEAQALDEISEPLRKAADTIENDDLRRKFLLAAGTCLARERRMGLQ